MKYKRQRAQYLRIDDDISEKRWVCNKCKTVVMVRRVPESGLCDVCLPKGDKSCPAEGEK
jgi:hypothetical protein